MMVDSGRIIARLLVSSVITIAVWTLMTHDFETVFGVIGIYAMVLFLQEEVYEQYKILKNRILNRCKSKRSNKNIRQRKGA